MKPSISRLAAALLCLAEHAPAVELRSPNGEITATVDLDASSDLVYTVSRGGHTIVSPSRIGITINGADLGQGVIPGNPKFGETSENVAARTGKTAREVRANTLALPLRHSKTGQSFTIEARSSDDGFAWRLNVPGEGKRLVQGEASAWQMPADSRVWFGERNSPWKLKTYAGEFRSAPFRNLGEVSAQGPVQCPPLLVELPGQAGLALITEAALADYSGLRLKANPATGLQADFSEGGEGFSISGPIVTPWRVILVVPDLNRLVNSAFVASLNPPPDPRFFPNPAYIKPGRCAWRWWSKGTGNPAEERAMIDDAVALGFEYSLIDDGWERWPKAWEKIREITEYARGRSVGVFIWKDSNAVSNPDNNYSKLRSFLDDARKAKVAGVKMDFFNSEAKTGIDFQRALLRMAAERQLMVVFHGVQKPTGEARTFPNEITREAVRGLELNKMSEGPIPPGHNAALPFVRYPIGAGDYTPLGYSHPGPTTWAHQLATVIQTDSPLLVIAEHPDMLLRDSATKPGLDVLKAIPATWEETRVLPGSRVGELSMLARRKGDDWFIAILSGGKETPLPKLDLSALGGEACDWTMLSSPKPRLLLRHEGRAISQMALPAKIPAGDGIVIWLRKR